MNTELNVPRTSTIADKDKIQPIRKMSCIYIMRSVDKMKKQITHEISTAQIQFLYPRIHSRIIFARRDELK